MINATIIYTTTVVVVVLAARNRGMNGDDFNKD